MPKPVNDAYDALMQRLLSLGLTGELTLSPEARQVYLDYGNRVEARLGDGCDWESMRDWGSKHPGMMLRIAGLLHAAELEDRAVATPISAAVMARAVQIAECLGEHAAAAYDAVYTNPVTAIAKRLLSKFLDLEVDQISKRDFFARVRSRSLATLNDFNPALKDLKERGYILEVERPNERARPSKVLILNPQVGDDGDSGAMRGLRGL